MRRMPILHRRIFQHQAMQLGGIWGIRPSFPGLPPCGGQVAYVLLTSAPVAARSIATPALPLDLHVLSLSLAFILSQDQTLHCTSFIFFLLKTYPARSPILGPRLIECNIRCLLLYLTVQSIPKSYLVLSTTFLAVQSCQCPSPQSGLFPSRKRVQRYCLFST